MNFVSMGYDGERIRAIGTDYSASMKFYSLTFIGDTSNNRNPLFDR